MLCHIIGVSDEGATRMSFALGGSMFAWHKLVWGNVIRLVAPPSLLVRAGSHIHRSIKSILGKALMQSWLDFNLVLMKHCTSPVSLPIECKVSVAPALSALFPVLINSASVNRPLGWSRASSGVFTVEARPQYSAERTRALLHLAGKTTTYDTTCSMLPNFDTVIILHTRLFSKVQKETLLFKEVKEKKVFLAVRQKKVQSTHGHRLCMPSRLRSNQNQAVKGREHRGSHIPNAFINSFKKIH